MRRRRSRLAMASESVRAGIQLGRLDASLFDFDRAAEPRRPVPVLAQNLPVNVENAPCCWQ